MASFFITACFLILCYCTVSKPAFLQASEQKLSVAWNIVPQENREGLPNLFTSEIVLTNRGDQSLGNTGWQLYFNFCRKILPESVEESVRIVHRNGDLFLLEPQSHFAPILPGNSRTIRFQTNAWVIKETDAPSGCYLLLKDELSQKTKIEVLGKVTVGPIASRRQTERTHGDLVRVPTPGSRYLENQALEQDQSTSSTIAIVPSPIVFRQKSGAFALDRHTVICAESSLESEAAYLAESLHERLGIRLPVQLGSPGSLALKKAISISISELAVGGISKTAGDGAYRLVLREGEGVTLVGTDATGVFHGIQSLRSLLPASVYRESGVYRKPGQEALQEILLGAVEIEDAPRFGYRGLHLDVARNFQTPASVKKLLELMALYKLNKLHFHLTDDEGWRLEIAGLPELTDVGGQRSHSLGSESTLPPAFGSGPISDAAGSYGSGHYTRQEFVDLLRYAAARHIEVIPEIDLPGHARAAIRAMKIRHERLLAKGKAEEAVKFLLHNPQDQSRYESVQLWNDNVIDICQESSYAFIRHVTEDIRSMYAEAGLQLATLHLGGDEVPEGVWRDSPACQKLQVRAEGNPMSVEKEVMGHFFKTVSDSLITHGIKAAAWEEVFLNDEKASNATHDLASSRFSGPNFQCHVWNNVWGWGQEDAAYRLANSGVDVVLCNATHLYFDLAYNKDPKEPGYYWAGFVDTKAPYSFAPMNYLAKTHKDLMGQSIPHEASARYARLTPKGEKHILGIQGQLWGENLKGEKSLEYMALPRVIALAERAWAKQPGWARDHDPSTWPARLQKSWAAFAKRLGTYELPRLDYLRGGYHYRIPLPGAVVEGGVLKANIAYPGLEIRYTTDSSEPTRESPRYNEPVRVDSSVRIRAFTRTGRGGRSCLVPEQDPE